MPMGGVGGTHIRNGWILFLAGLGLIIAGSGLAGAIQTTDGTQVRDVRFPGADGVMMSGLLYIPRRATVQTPAPGILAVHGYINSRETQDGFAIEFARRGYVVLAMDQTGHGYSGGQATSAGFGGPAGLKYLRSLPMVDRTRIGLEGHSMGGWAVLAAAAAMPDAYRAMVLEGSSTGKPFAAGGTKTWPRNLAVVYSRYDEFSKLMWGVDRARDVGASVKLKALFRTAADVQAGRIYGAIGQGTARRLATPLTTHPGDHISTAAIGESLDWFAATLGAPTPRSRDDQIWYWKEAGTGVALIGFVMLIMGVFDLCLRTQFFSGLRQDGEPALTVRTGRWWGWLALMAFIPIVTLLPAFALAAWVLKPSPLFPQAINNQVMVWALVNAGIALAIGAFRRSKTFGRPSREIAVSAVAVSLLAVSAGYLALLAMDRIFTVDFRFWVVALKLPSRSQAVIILHYFLPLLLFFAVAFRSLHQRLSVVGDSAAAQYWFAILAMAGGFFVFLVLDYGIFFLTGNLPTAMDPLTTIISIQFLPLMIAVAVWSVFTWRRTNNYLPGAMISAMLVCWYVVAGTATHVI